MTIKPGAIRFNTDSMKLEIFRGADVGIGTLAAGQWEEIQATSPDDSDWWNSWITWWWK